MLIMRSSEMHRGCCEILAMRDWCGEKHRADIGTVVGHSQHRSKRKASENVEFISSSLQSVHPLPINYKHLEVPFITGLVVSTKNDHGMCGCQGFRP